MTKKAMEKIAGTLCWERSAVRQEWQLSQDVWPGAVIPPHQHCLI